MRLDGFDAGVFGNTAPHAAVWFRRAGIDTILAREAGGARLLRPGLPAWVQARGDWGGGDPHRDYSLNTAAGPFDVVGGATEWTAGQGAYTAYLDGLRWNAPVPPPAGAACWDTDPETGVHVLVRHRETGQGLLIYRPDGAPIAERTMPVSWARIRDGVLSVLTAGRLYIADVTQAGIANERFVETLFAPYQPHAIRWRGRRWVVYHVAHEARGLLNTLVAHPEDSLEGIVVAPEGVLTYGLDVRVFGDVAAVGYAFNEGETFGAGDIHAIAGDIVDLRAAVTLDPTDPSAGVVLPTFAAAGYPFLLMGLPESPRRLTWFEDPHKDDPRIESYYLEASALDKINPATGRLRQAEYDEQLRDGIAFARARRVPLILHDEMGPMWTDARERDAKAVEAHGIRCRRSKTAYPLVEDGRLLSVAETTRRHRDVFDDMARRGPLHLWFACFDQWSPAAHAPTLWGLQSVVDVAAAVYRDVLLPLRIEAASCFDLDRLGGMRTYPVLYQLAQRIQAYWTETNLFLRARICRVCIGL